MGAAYSQIIISAKDQASGVFRSAGAQVGGTLAKMRADAVEAGQAFSTMGTSVKSLADPFVTLNNAGRVSGQTFAALGLDARGLQRDLGLTDKSFADLQRRMTAKAASRGQEAALRNIAVAADLTEDEIRKLGRQFKLTAAQIDKVNAGLRVSASRSAFLGTAVRGALAYFSVNTLIRFGAAATDAMDRFTGLENKLKLSTETTRELNSVMSATYEIAAATRNGWEGTADLYARLERSTRDLDYSQQDLLDVTTAVNHAVAISGTTAQAAEAALFQMGQGLGAGALRGEELNSVLEQTPRLAKAIADGLGVTIAQLREMGAKGELTAEKVVEAIRKEQETLRDEFSRTTPTMEQGWTRVGDAATQFFGVLDDNLGVSDKMGSSLNIMAEAIDRVTASMNSGSPTTRAYLEYLKTFVMYGGTGGALMRGVQDAGTTWLVNRQNSAPHSHRTKVDRSATHPDEPHYHAKVNWSATHPDKDATDKRLAESHDIYEKWMQRRGDLLTEWERKAEKTSEKVARDLSMSAFDEAAYWHAAMYGNEPIDTKRADRRGDNADDEITEMQAVYDEKQRILDEFTEAHARATMSAADYAIMQLDRERAELESTVADKVALDQWYAASRARILRMYGEQEADWTDGARDALEDFQDDATDVSGNVETVMYNSLNGISDCITDFVTTGKASWSDLAQSVIQSITNMTTEYLMAQALMGGGSFSGGDVGGLIGWGVGLFTGSSFNVGGAVGTSTGTGGGFNMGSGVVTGLHDGGVAGRDATFRRSVDMSMFHGAPRFHDGLLPDEFPAILKRGEGVFTQEQMKALGGGGNKTDVRVVNNFYVQPDAGGNISQKSQRQISRAVTQSLGRFR